MEKVPPCSWSFFLQSSNSVVASTSQALARACPQNRYAFTAAFLIEGPQAHLYWIWYRSSSHPPSPPSNCLSRTVWFDPSPYEQVVDVPLLVLFHEVDLVERSLTRPRTCVETFARWRGGSTPSPRLSPPRRWRMTSRISRARIVDATLSTRRRRAGGDAPIRHRRDAVAFTPPRASSNSPERVLVLVLGGVATTDLG